MPESAPICLLVNPAAGGGKAARLAPQAERALRSHGLAVRRVDTRDLQHARELAVSAARAGERVVVLSGDGAIGVVAEALRDVPGAVLGVLPGGRGNDLARALGVSQEIDAGVRDDRRRRRAPDGRRRGARRRRRAGAQRSSASPRPASTATPTGSPTKRRPGSGNLVYAYGALRALLAWRPARFEIELDPPGERRSFTRLHGRRVPTRAPTAAACAPRPTRCSTTACSR